MAGRVTLCFERDIPLARMRQMMARGPIWINHSAHNRAAVETIWAGLSDNHEMPVTITSAYDAPTPESLEIWIDNVVVHFPDTDVLELAGFPDTKVSDELMAKFGFQPEGVGTQSERSYRRANGPS